MRAEGELPRRGKRGWPGPSAPTIFTGSGASVSEALRGNRSKQVSLLNTIRTQVGQPRVLSIETELFIARTRPFLSSSTLPHCPLRACFATAHKGRGCGDSGPPFPAPGSGGPQSRARRCLSFRARPKRKIGGRMKQAAFRNQLGTKPIRFSACQGADPLNCGSAPWRCCLYSCLRLTRTRGRGGGDPSSFQPRICRRYCPRRPAPSRRCAGR